MELSTEDKQRIEQEAKEAEKNRSMHDVYNQITPYVSGYILGSIIERRNLEAERSELRNKVIEEAVVLMVKAAEIESDPMFILCYSSVIGKLNSLKTK